MLETVYEEALCWELELRGIAYARQVAATIEYKGRAIAGQRVDLLVAGEVVVELKSVRLLPEVALSQALSYWRALGCRRGLLITFGVPRLVDGIKRVSL